MFPRLDKKYKFISMSVNGQEIKKDQNHKENGMDCILVCNIQQGKLLA